MDWDDLKDPGDGREERDETMVRAGMGRTKKCFESDRMVWKCSTRRCLGGPLRDFWRRRLCLMKERREGEIGKKNRRRAVSASEEKRGVWPEARELTSLGESEDQKGFPSGIRKVSRFILCLGSRQRNRQS